MIVDVLADYGISQRLAQITIIGFVAAGIIGYFWRIIVIGVILVSIISIFATGSTKPKENPKVEPEPPTVQTIVPKPIIKKEDLQNPDELEKTEDDDAESEAEKQRQEKELQEFIKTLPAVQTIPVKPVKVFSEEEQYIKDCRTVAKYSYIECKRMWLLKHD
jgi:bifunctional DNA-binding transcriptional regulator/antitoxin component of YhaV-PrlF toxin-antitoxin module